MTEIVHRHSQLPPVVGTVLSDLGALAERIGSAGGLVQLRAAAECFAFAGVGDQAAIRGFAADYLNQVVCQVELPMICRAYCHSNRFEVRELIALDAEFGSEWVRSGLAQPSQQAGQAQLNGLRPLLDQRVIKRYLEAIDRGEAKGWHTVVYGVVLSIYSQPLRQGLLDYASQTLSGVMRSLDQKAGEAGMNLDYIRAELAANLPAMVDRSIARSVVGQCSVRFQSRTP